MRGTRSTHRPSRPALGPLTFEVHFQEHGRTLYVVRGRHIRGSFVVIPEAAEDGPVLPKTVRIQYGRDGDGDYWRTPREDAPLVHNVRIHGWTDGIDPDNPPSGWYLGSYAVNLRDNGIRRDLTTGARRRTAAVVQAVVRHWSRLPERAALVLAAATIRAAGYAEHEAGLAKEQEAKAASIQGERARVRSRLHAVNGISRRHPSPQGSLRAEWVPVGLVDDKGRDIGTMRVREVEFSEALPGSVIYEVEGRRLAGRFTVGCDQWRPEPLPQGVRVTYGHVEDPSPFRHEHPHEPVVFGVRVGGRWDCDWAAQITAAAPGSLSATARTGVRARMSASDAAERYCSSVLRALALHYLARPDRAALQLAAGQSNVLHQRAGAREELRQLREKQRRAERAARCHRRREAEYQSMADQGGGRYSA
ncbi:hypothetical protein [Streptomyces anulatus]|uniref:hypothetical protein n=1 Tax=Streptomyces anulatus TaxID=1892 RepID=UPI001C255F67|nr:hypothetical protein [Streptomyces anulatus]